MNMAQEAYEAYARHTGWKSLATGQQLPQWDDLKDEIKSAWRTSTAWVIGKVTGNHEWQIPRLDQEHAAMIESNAKSGNTEEDHSVADDVLCKLLRRIGCDKTVDAWANVEKWYS